jgi:hypothetical protein
MIGDTSSRREAAPDRDVRPRRAALTGIPERGQVLGVDLLQVPKQDSARNTYSLERDPTQRRLDFFAQVDSKQLDLFASRETN